MARILGAPVMDAGGKQARSRSTGTTARPQFARDFGKRVVDGGEGNQFGVPRHANRARAAHAAEVVAGDVDYHGELRAVLFACDEVGCEGAIFVRGFAARPRAFDGTGANVAVAHIEEQFGTDRENGAVAAGPDERAVRRGADGAQAEVEGPDLIAGERCFQAAAEVHLKELAVADALDRAGDRGLETGGVGAGEWGRPFGLPPAFSRRAARKRGGSLKGWPHTPRIRTTSHPPTSGVLEPPVIDSELQIRQVRGLILRQRQVLQFRA